MGAKTYRADDPNFAAYIAGAAARTVEQQSKPPAPYHPAFSDYVAGKTDPPVTKEEKKAMATKIAEQDEVVTLPDGRQIQIQAKGKPVVEELAELERERLAKAAEHETEVDHLREIQPDPGTRALGVGGNERIVDSKGALGAQTATTVQPAPVQPTPAPRTQEKTGK